MKKLSCLALLTCFLVTLSGTAFAWSDRSEGRPQQNPPGLSVWHNRNDEFHLKTTNFRNQHVFSGVIRTDGRFYDIDDRDLENGDFVKVDRDRNTIRFHFTGRGIDELDFKVRGGDTLTFDVNKDGHDMASNEIYIGKHGWHPRDNRFTLKE
ncbi:hypothetical protein [Pelosinus sp. UFO1]|uniref:hypothetical protein n=1 Tax=Pelosinus sp. UFO1 TaxID=484770 RepID=UPI0004D16FC3|nr:hypothetical protein [Pelosinus sp. UFO1]AIF51291.1 hypothetical protein UFO1_1740 [Pelosinus sp. UFO1]